MQRTYELPQEPATSELSHDELTAQSAADSAAVSTFDFHWSEDATVESIPSAATSSLAVPKRRARQAPIVDGIRPSPSPATTSSRTPTPFSASTSSGALSFFMSSTPSPSLLRPISPRPLLLRPISPAPELVVRSPALQPISSSSSLESDGYSSSEAVSDDEMFSNFVP